jgi:hypothetical protein
MYEPSGTEDQIVTRLRRGDGIYAIREELGCAPQRIRKIAAAHGIEIAPIIRKSRCDNGEVTLKTDTPSPTRRPQVRLTLPVGWSAVRVIYPSDDGDVITVRRVQP